MYYVFICIRRCRNNLVSRCLGTFLYKLGNKLHGNGNLGTFRYIEVYPGYTSMVTRSRVTQYSRLEMILLTVRGLFTIRSKFTIRVLTYAVFTLKTV